jgi:hypothetical protein
MGQHLFRKEKGAWEAALSSCAGGGRGLTRG